jgi:hypothetical protein
MIPSIDERWFSDHDPEFKIYRLRDHTVSALNHNKNGSFFHWVACEAMVQTVCEPKNILNHLSNTLGITVEYDTLNPRDPPGVTNGPWQSIAISPTLGMKFAVFSETLNGVNEEEESGVLVIDLGGGRGGHGGGRGGDGGGRGHGGRGGYGGGKGG